MRRRLFDSGIQALAMLLGAIGTASAATKPPDAPAAATTKASWDKAAAAKYLDSREVWWQAWPPAQKDHETICVSCHTNVPYALARPLLRDPLNEQGLSQPERVMLDSIIKRVNLGTQAAPFYNDAKHGPGKTREARNTEGVNNALILSRYDAQQGHLQDVTRKAFDSMWASQEQTGDKAERAGRTFTSPHGKPTSRSITARRWQPWPSEAHRTTIATIRRFRAI